MLKASLVSSAIGRTCPRLQNLALSAVGQFDPLNSVNAKWFSQLQALEMWSDPSQELSSCLLRQLLISRHLKNLLFTGCSILTDQLFNEIWQVRRERRRNVT